MSLRDYQRHPGRLSDFFQMFEREFRHGDVNIYDFFREMEEREFDEEENLPLYKLDAMLGQFGPGLIFRLAMMTLHEMGDLDNLLNIIEPMAHDERARRMQKTIYTRRDSRDPFFDLERGERTITGRANFVIDDIVANELKMGKSWDEIAADLQGRADDHVDTSSLGPNAMSSGKTRPLNPLDYRQSDIFQEQVRRKRTRPNRR